MKVFKEVFPFIKKYWWMYFLGFLSLLVVNSMQLLIPQVNKRVFDSLIYGTANNASLLRYGIYIVLLGAGMGTSRFFWRWCIIGSSRRLETELRNKFYRHVMSLSAKWFDNNKVGDIMALATNDLEAVRMFFAIGFVAILDAALFGLASLVILFTINWKLTLFTLIPLPFLSILMTWMGPKLEKRSKAVQEAFAGLTDKTREIFSGIRVVKAYTQEKPEKLNFSTLNDEYVKKNMRMILLWGFFDPVIGTVIGFAFGIVLFMGGKQVILMNMTIGDFVAFTNYLDLLIWPMMAVGWVINLYQRAKASMSRINEVLEVKPDITDVRDAIEFEQSEGAIEYKNLTFAYNKDHNVLEDINIKIEPGKFIAIVGRTGSGKTTLVNLLPRLYDPPEGTVFIDGMDVRSFTKESLRNKIGIVSQETFLFSESIRENILFAETDEEKKAAEHCAQIAQIHEQIIGFPKGYEEEIGERGVTLSGGQKQRLSIARTLMKNTPILILDDSLSAVDTEIEKRILDGLEEYFEKKTVILISHRISTVMNADFIYVIDEGKIVEQGTHSELLDHDGIYAEINKLQALEKELEQK